MTGQRTKSTVFIFLATALLLLGFWLRVHQLASLPTGLSADEATHAVDGLQISQSGSFPIYEDFGRPEPLYNVFMALGALFFGPHLFTFRLISVLAGVLTIAAVCWAMRQCVPDSSPATRWAVALVAAAALTVCLSHITLSRALYRAILQPFFMLLFIGFLLRGLRKGRRRDFVLSGLNLGICLYTYTAALAVPASLAAVVLSLLIFQRKRWKSWLPNLIVLAVIFAILLAPIAVRFLNERQSVVGRAGDVSNAQNGTLIQSFSRVLTQFEGRGDPNPQYNVDSVPLIPPAFTALFSLGLLALLVRVRQPSSWLIVSLLLLCTLPVVAANEIPHGLRIMGEFAVFPLVIGAAVAFLLALANHLPRQLRRSAYAVLALLIILMTGSDTVWAQRTYSDSWVHPTTLKMFDLQLTTVDWFFRTDLREFGEWINAQQKPLLLPLDALSEAATRAWIMTVYPVVKTADDTFKVPVGTQLVVPWQLEAKDLRRQTRDYVLLDKGVITLLPPLSVSSHNALLAHIDQADAVNTKNGNLMARVMSLPESPAITFEPRAINDSAHTPLAIFGNELQIMNWRGPDILDQSTNTVTYTLDWSAVQRPGNYYSSFVQLQTQDYKGIAGDDILMLRWLYPPTMWQRGDDIPDTHTLTIPADLAPGAYRLVAGAYVFVDKRLQAVGPAGDSLGDAPTLGWVKVPQANLPAIPKSGIDVDASIDGMFGLRHAAVETLPDGKLHLILDWQALVRRPNIDATIFVHVVDKSGKMIAQQDARPWNGQYPTFIWDQGETVQTDYTFDVGTAAKDDLNIEIGMYTFPDQKRLSVIQNGSAAADNVIRLNSLSALMGQSF